MNKTPKFIIDLARENRRNATKAEAFAWRKLRNRKYRGYKFTRQFPLIHTWNEKELHFFIADFYCHQLKLVVEIDGGYHKENKEYDQWRDEVIDGLEIRTLRIINEDVSKMYSIIDEYLNNNPMN